MNTKSNNESHQRLVDKKQHAVKCARQRDEWSSELARQREDQTLADLDSLRQQVEVLTAERDSARARAALVENLQQQVAVLDAEREAVRRQAELVDELQQQIADLTAERNAARERGALIENLQQRVTVLDAEREAACCRAERVDALQDQIAELTAERDAERQRAARFQSLQREVDELAAERHTAQVQSARLEALEQELADVVSQRAAAGCRVTQLEAELTQVGTRLESAQAQLGTQPAVASLPPSDRRGNQQPTRTAAAASVVLALGVMASVMTIHDAQSTVQAGAGSGAEQLVATLHSAAAPLAADDKAGSEEKKPAPGTRKNKTRFANGKSITHRQWGPSLFELDPPPAKSGHLFDPVVKELQGHLLVLGFDLGEADGFSGQRTEQAVREFKSLYLSDANLQRPLSRAALTAITRNYAELAREDADAFNVDRGVVAAIRLSSVRTGIEFSYLMKLAAVESNFDPAGKAGGSSATGLYQFTRDTWLNTVKDHGDKYGLERYTAKIEYTVDRNGFRRPLVRDGAVYEHLMALRTNPRLSAMMAAESVRDNARRLARSFDRAPSEADLYLTHFFGPEGAISFLRALDQTPDAFAVDMFPAAAQSNQDIFHPKTCNPRTVDEVYALFGQKFNARRFDSLAAN